MTPEEIKTKVERYTKKSDIDIDYIMDAIEESINWLSNMGYIIDSIKDNYDAKEFYELPNDIVGLIKVEDVEEDEMVEDYVVDGNLIRFGEEGEYRIFAERQPKIPSSSDEELELHPSLQYAILDYTKGFIKVSTDDRSEDGHRLMQKFQEDSVKFYQSIVRGKNNVTSWTVKRRG